MVQYMATRHDGIRQEIRKNRISDAMADQIRTHLDHFKASFLEKHGVKKEEEDTDENEKA